MKILVLKVFHRLGPLDRVGHRVAMSVCLYVCMYVCHKSCNCQLWPNDHIFFKYKIEWVNVVPRILNLEGHQNCMIGSKVKTILTMFFVHN